MTRDTPSVAVESEQLSAEIRAIRRSLDELNRGVERLEQRLRGLEPPPDERRTIGVPDTPYDRALWTDSDDEGLGARDRRAP